ncbi:nitroreductase family protein [Kocuria sp. M1R5S2]|uniref:nitroreductase family protein n=1 Tax=Kocuria rhizosphaerae TaxID=3376285 RepID=UPI003795B181
MSRTFLRVLAQRRPATALTPDAPPREELETVLRAAAGTAADRPGLSWRVAVTTRRSAPELAAALAGMTRVPNMAAPFPRLKGKQLRRLAAFRGALKWASTGGLGCAVIFSPDDALGSSRKEQLAAAHGARPLLEAAFWAAGWATAWAARDGAGEDAVRAFYGLAEDEKILGWLFVGRPPRAAAADHAATRPTPGPRVTYL